MPHHEASSWPPPYQAPVRPRLIADREPEPEVTAVTIPDHLACPDISDYVTTHEVALLERRAVERHRIAIRRYISDCARRHLAPMPADVLDALQRGKIRPRLDLDSERQS